MEPTVTDALQAMTLEESPIEELTVYVGGLTSPIEPGELQQQFVQCGYVRRVVLPLDRLTGQFKGYAFVEFVDQVSVEKALLFNQCYWRGNTLTIMKKFINSDDALSVYVGNLWSASRLEIEQIFSPCGPLRRLTLPVNKWTGHPKGYAFIEFETMAAKEKALLLNNSEFKGMVLLVKKKRTNLPGFIREGLLHS